MLGRRLAGLFAGVALALLPVQSNAGTMRSVPQVSVGATCSFSRIDFTTGSLGAASLARGSSGTYLNVSGVLTTAITNAARFNYVGGVGPSLLVEPAGTNLAGESNAFSTSPWFVTAATITNPGTITSPDGTTDGWKLTSTSFGSVSQTPSTSLSAVAYLMSGWDQQNTAGIQYFFQINSTISGVQTSTASWVRFAFLNTPTAGAANVTNNINASTGSLNMFGFQLEVAAASGYFATNPSSYIPNAGATTASRSADVVTFTQPAGCGHNTYTFDDNSTQTVTQAPGTATVPTGVSLNRPNIKFIDGSA